MSYGDPRWISDWTYERLGEGTCPVFGGASSSVSAELSDVPQAWAQADEYLFAAGVVSPTEGTAVLRTFYRTSDPNPEFLSRSLAYAQEDGAYSLILEDANGTALYTHAFTTTALTDAGPSPDQEAFAEILPYHAQTARVVLEQDGKQVAARAVSAYAPVVTLLSPNGG
jgi:hypothetical protein